MNITECHLKFNSWTERERVLKFCILLHLLQNVWACVYNEEKGHCVHNKTWAHARDLSLGKYCLSCDSRGCRHKKLISLVCLLDQARCVVRDHWCQIKISLSLPLSLWIILRYERDLHWRNNIHLTFAPAFVWTNTRGVEISMMNTMVMGLSLWNIEHLFVCSFLVPEAGV